MTLETEGDKHVVVTRRFAAPPEAVYRAHTEPKLIQKWLLGPDGWAMPVCINEARPNGKIRYEWTNGEGGGFHLTGEFLELEPYRRIVHVERMHLPNPTPDNHIETRFDPGNGSELRATRKQFLGWSCDDSRNSPLHGQAGASLSSRQERAGTATAPKLFAGPVWLPLRRARPRNQAVENPI